MLGARHSGSRRAECDGKRGTIYLHIQQLRRQAGDAVQGEGEQLMLVCTYLSWLRCSVCIGGVLLATVLPAAQTGTDCIIRAHHPHRS